MKRSVIKLCQVAVISLLCSVIWHGPAVAAVAPSIVSLGTIRGADYLSSPGRIDVDASGNIYVTDVRKKAVVKFDPYGEFVRFFAAAPVSGRGVAVSPDGSLIYVAGIDVVSVLDGNSGEVIRTLGVGPGEFNTAGEVDLDASGFVYVADSGARIVKVYNPQGQLETQFGGFGIAPGQFRMLWSMTVNEAAGEVYVADVETLSTTMVPKVQVFDLAGNFLANRTLVSTTSFGTPVMTFFGGMAFDQSGRGYFLDSFRNFIRVLGLPTTYLANYAQAGMGTGQLAVPSDLVFDPVTSRLFVVCDGARVEVFGIDGGQNPVNVNVAPGQPVPLSPVDGSEVASANPVLLFQNAEDQDGDTLTYQVLVTKEGQTVAEYGSIPEAVDNSSVEVSPALAENARYQWMVQASDGEEVSGWSAAQSFYVNAVQESPVAPELVSPDQGAILDGEGVLSWGASADPDPFDTVSYELEISSDPAFAGPVLKQTASGTSLVLADLAEYAALEDGGNYYWRVVAVDNDGLASDPSASRSFVYDTTSLKVVSNVPGARVYVGGNYGYAGRYIGDAPVEVRDFPAGATSVVVERAGLETFVREVNIVERENLVLAATLVPAIASADLKARPIQAAGVDILVNGDAAPFAVDFNGDNLVDLLVGDATGEVALYLGAMTAEGLFYYSAPVSIGFSVLPGAAPFVADWDNDGDKDLLMGASDGSVTLYTNTGSDILPAFAGGTVLAASNAPVDVGDSAVPAVYDVDADGDKDLVVGSAAGFVFLFRNDGTDAAPQLVQAGSLVRLSGAVAPFFADWDSDGVKDLLLAASEHLYVYRKQADGSYAASAVLAVGSDLLGRPGPGGRTSAGAFSLGDRLRLFVYDADGQKGKDLVVGNSTGAIRLVHANGSEYVAAFAPAMLAKVAEIRQLMADAEVSPAAGALADDIEAALAVPDYKNAEKAAKGLVEVLPAGTAPAQAVAELLLLLK